MWKLNELERPILLGTELGQELYIPDSANNPLMLLKKGCPIWIRINENDDCIVHYIIEEQNWEKEINDIIRNNVERGQWVIYAPLTDKYKRILNIESNDDFNLSCVALDGNNHVRAAIIIDKDSYGRMKISKIVSPEHRYIKLLANHIRVSKTNVERYRSQLLWYTPTDGNNYADLLGMMRTENGEYFWQFE